MASIKKKDNGSYLITVSLGRDSSGKQIFKRISYRPESKSEKKITKEVTGRVFGLMPHPEAFLSPYNAPDWTNQREKGTLPAEGEGAIFFRNAKFFSDS